jgi:DNA-binding transcriptional LysR family regulator
VTFDPARTIRTVALGVSDLAEITLLSSLNEILRREAPNCDLRTIPIGDEGLDAALESGEVSLLIHNAPPRGGGLMQQALFTEHFSVIAHRGTLARTSKEICWSLAFLNSMHQKRPGASPVPNPLC